MLLDAIETVPADRQRQGFEAAQVLETDAGCRCIVRPSLAWQFMQLGLLLPTNQT